MGRVELLFSAILFASTYFGPFYLYGFLEPVFIICMGPNNRITNPLLLAL